MAHSSVFLMANLLLLQLILCAHLSAGRHRTAGEFVPELVEQLLPKEATRSVVVGPKEANNNNDNKHKQPASYNEKKRRVEQVDEQEQEASITEPKLSKRVQQRASAFDLWDEHLLLDIIPVVLGQRGCNENGTFERYRELLLKDDSNDAIMLSSSEEIIERSGFQYERHESLSDDGYSTKLLRLKNPLVQSARALKQPPVMLLQSGAISATAFIGASAAQHHPELPAQRARANKLRLDLDPEEGPLEHPVLSLLMSPLSGSDEQLARQSDGTSEGDARSSNRSLAFMLANQGYDVWLVESRGHRSKMTQRNPLDKIVNSLGKTSKSVVSLLFGSNRHKNMTLGESVVQLSRAPHYWTYSFDEIIRHEIKNQIKKVLEVSGAQNVTLISYSFASMVTLPFLASRPKFVRKRVHNLVLMAPILSNRGANTLFNYLYQFPCLKLPDDLIAFFGTSKILTRPLRRLLVQLGRNSALVRYKVLKFLLYLFQGPSGQYRTFLEPALYGHFLEPTSLLQVKHFCQQVLARKYQRYNFGRIKNLLVYGQEEPPVYDISRMNLKPGHWMLISAENDNLATKDSVELLLDQLDPKPAQHIQLAGYAHLDLIAAVDNDRQVNLPILNYLERHRYSSD